MYLDEVLDEIEQAYVNVIQDAVDNSGDPYLSLIKQVIRGDKVRGQPRLPALWIFSDDPEQTHEPTTRREKWVIPVHLAVVIMNSEDPQAGYHEATAFVCRARSFILKNSRTLGLRDYVQDTVSQRIIKGRPELSDGKRHAATAVMRTTFIIEEGF